MTRDEFIRNNRGIDDGKDVPQEILSKIYDNIKAQKLRGPKDETDGERFLTLFQTDYHGWLKKEKARFRTTTKRWFRLTQHCLFYSYGPQDEQFIAQIPLKNIGVRVLEKGKYDYGFEVFSLEGENSKIISSKQTSEGVIVGNRDSYFLYAESEEDRDKWMMHIVQATIYDTSRSKSLSSSFEDQEEKTNSFDGVSSILTKIRRTPSKQYADIESTTPM